MHKIKPYADFILVKEEEEITEEKTESGIIVPESQRRPKMYKEAEVLDVGEGVKDLEGHLIPVDVKKGQKVLFIKTSGCIEIDDNLLIKERNIVATKK